MAPSVTYFDLDYDVTCIDVEYTRPRMACCYLVINQGKAAIIETGTNHSTPLVLQCLKEKGLTVEDVLFVIPTHVHLDHAGGVGSLMQACPQATLVIHPRGARHMIQPEKLTAASKVVYGETLFNALYGDLIPVDEKRVLIAEDNDTVSLSGRELRFIDSPGHAKHHFVVYDKMSQGVFTGDIFGACYQEFQTEKGPFIIPPTSPTQFDPQAWHQSIDQLMALKPKRAYLTHFGAVGDLPQLAADLHRRIDESCTMALACKNAENPFQEMTKQLMSQMKTDMKAHGCQLTESQLNEMLPGDIEVSIQGLEVWLNSQ